MFIYKCIIMAMPTRCSTFLNENLQKKLLPSCGYLKAKIYFEQSRQQYFFVSWYRHRVRGYRIKYLSICCLDIFISTNEGLGIYPIWLNIVFSPPCKGRPQ